MEQDNFQVGVRLLAAQQRIAKLRAERSVLLEMLSQFNPAEIDASDDVSGTDDDASDSQARPCCAAFEKIPFVELCRRCTPDASRHDTCRIAPILCFLHSITCAPTITDQSGVRGRAAEAGSQEGFQGEAAIVALPPSSCAELCAVTRQCAADDKRSMSP